MVKYINLLLSSLLIVAFSMRHVSTWPCLDIDCLDNKFDIEDEEVYSEEEESEGGKCGKKRIGEFSVELRVNGNVYRAHSDTFKGIGSEVYIGIDAHRKCVAIKMVNLEEGGGHLREEYLNEAKIFEMVRHKNAKRIIQLLDFEKTDANQLIFVLEFGEETLLEYWARKFPPEKKDRNEGDMKRARKVIREAAEGLDEIHSFGIIHSDLASKNMVIVRGEDGRKRLKYIDFGNSHILDENAVKRACRWKWHPRDKMECRANSVIRTERDTGTWVFMSREQFACEISQKSDIWSFGVLAYFLLVSAENGSSDQFPYPFPFPIEQNYSDAEMKEEIRHILLDLIKEDAQMECNFEPRHFKGAELGRKIFKHIAHLIKQCLKKDPYARPLAIDLVEHMRDGYAERKMTIGGPYKSKNWNKKMPAKLAETFLRHHCKQ